MLLVQPLTTPGWRSSGPVVPEMRGEEAMVSFIFSYFFPNTYLTHAPSFAQPRYAAGDGVEAHNGAETRDGAKDRPGKGAEAKAGARCRGL